MLADPGPVYFILHVPKTAGQTIQQHLADHCAPGMFWGPHQAPRLQALSGRRYKPGSLPGAAQIRAVFDHNLGRSLEKFFPEREIRRVVLLRDPISLQLSLYNHRMMLHLTRGLGIYGFDLHLKALPRDFVAHRLLALAGDPVAAADGDDRPTEIFGVEPGAFAILVCRIAYRL